MGHKQQFEVWREDLQIVLQSKVDEFHMLGYKQATPDQIWDCTIYKLRKKKEFIHLHSFVNSILTVRANEYMTWLTIQNYNSEDWFANEGVIENL